MMNEISLHKKRDRVLFFLVFTVSAFVIAAAAVVLSGHIPIWKEAPWPGVIMGACCMLGAVPLHIVGRQRSFTYLLACLLNAVGSALFIASYFTYADKTPCFGDMLLPVGIVVGFMAVRCLLVSFGKPGVILCLILLGMNFAAGIAVIVLWILYGGIFFPTLYFLLIPEFMQGLLLLCSLEQGESALRYISLASFSYAFLIGLVVLFILSEGELFEGLFEGLFDGLFDRSGSGGKMNRSR